MVEAAKLAFLKLPNAVDPLLCDRFGVVIRFSTEELLSLSVTCVER